MKKEYKITMAFAALSGGVIGWSFSRLIAPRQVVDLVDNANRMMVANEDILDFLTEQVESGALSDNPEFKKELGQRLTWAITVIEEEL